MVNRQMNLKESFRYQKFLDTLMCEARMRISDRKNALKITKTHLRSEANPDVEDRIEEVVVETLIPCDVIMEFMANLIKEKESISCAIGKSKASCGFDIDAAVETNKYRQNFRESIVQMLRYTSSEQIERDHDYKFNVEGNQTKYTYNVKVDYAEAYDREAAKKVMREIISEADTVSRNIDAALINTLVEYNPPYDVNDSFEDAINLFSQQTK